MSVPLGISSALVLVIIAAGTILELKRRSVTAIFWIASGGLYCAPLVLKLQALEERFSSATIIKGNLFVIGFCLMLLAARAVFPSHTAVPLAVAGKRANVTTNLLLLGLFFGTVLWATGIWMVSGNLGASTWTDSLKVASIMSRPANLLVFLCGGVITVAWVGGMRSRALLGGFIAIVLLLVTRARVYVIPVVMPAVAMWMLSRTSVKDRLKQLFVLVALVFAIFALQQVRYLGSIDEIGEASSQEVAQRTAAAISEGVGELSLSEGFYTYIERNNKMENFGEGRTYLRIAFMFVPTQLASSTGMELKPRDFAVDMHEALFPELSGMGGTYHPTIFGDAYANFGFFGVALGFVFGGFFAAVDRVQRKLSPVMAIAALSPIATFHVLLARGAVYSAFFQLVAAMIALVVLNAVIQRAFDKAIQSRVGVE